MPHSNTGDRNTGNWNTGGRNTGNWNTGDLNTGDRNTGNWNTGNWNTGDRNTGNWNTGGRNTGHLNTGSHDDFRVFDRPLFRGTWLNAEKPLFLSHLSPLILVNNTIVGTRTLQEHFALLWGEASEEERQQYLNLPNHDPAVSAKLWDMPESVFRVAKPKPPQEITIEGATYVLKEN